MAAVSRLLTAWAILLVLFAVPATALAQSAGDDQYSDPLAGSEQPSTQQGQQQQSDSGRAPRRRRAGADAERSRTPAQSGTATDGAESGDDSLPRTGLDVMLLFAAAAPLLLGGFALRRVARDV